METHAYTHTHTHSAHRDVVVYTREKICAHGFMLCTRSFWDVFAQRRRRQRREMKEPQHTYTRTRNTQIISDAVIVRFAAADTTRSCMLCYDDDDDGHGDDDDDVGLGD